MTMVSFPWPDCNPAVEINLQLGIVAEKETFVNF